MDDNIMGILDETINRNMEINGKALEKLIYTTCSQKNLDEYVNDIYFTDKVLVYPSPMAYSMVEKMIIVNLYRTGRFLKELKTLISENDLLETEHQGIFLKIVLQQIILHEMEHAHQNKLIRKEETGIEAKLVRLNAHMLSIVYNPTIIKMANIYKELGEALKENRLLEANLHNKYGSSMPIERLAEYHSIKEILFYLSFSTTNYFDIIDMLGGSLVSNLLDSYHFSLDISSPTERYINDFKQANFIGGNRHFTKEFYCLLDEAKSDTLERRLSLGLDITRDEYTKVKKIII